MPQRTDNTISHQDVSRAMREVAKTWNCRLKITLSVPINSDSGKAWDVRIAVLRYAGKGVWSDCEGISRPWPSNGHKTMTGLLLALVYELDASLQRRAEESEAEQGQLRLALW